MIKRYSVSGAIFLMSFFSFSQLQAQQIKRETLLQIEALLNEKNSRNPVEQKIDSRLLQAVREKAGQQMVKGVQLDAANVNADKLGNLKVDINATITDALLEKLNKLGVNVIFPSAEYHTIRATVNLSMVKVIAAYPEVQFIQPAAVYQTVDAGTKKQVASENNTRLLQQKLTINQRNDNVRKQLISILNAQGSINAEADGNGTGNLPITSEGDRTHRVDDTRNKYGYSGEGIKIGVLSNSYNAQNGAAADIASGNLPGAGNPFGNTQPVTVVQDLKGSDDEGRAMLQIVHDLVPKAKLFFATAGTSPASFANNIQALRFTYHCDVIIDDVEFINEPVFQDGTIAQAVNAVTANGAMYFSSAGNSGSLEKGTSGVFEGDFNDAGSLAFSGGSKTGTIHNFGTVSSPVNGDIITIAGGYYTLNWSDPLGKSSNDYDLFLVKADGSVRGSSTNVQNGTQDPYEGITGSTLLGTPRAFSTGDRLIVFKAASAAKRAFHLATNRGTLTVATNGEVSGHNSAGAAFSVAAAPAYSPFGPGESAGPYPNAFSATSKVESFSSDGPRRVFYNADTTVITAGNFLFATNGGTVRMKPDVTAADGVSTTFASSTGLSPFYGTSAAAPHAGAIAGLLKSADPTLTPAQIRTLLTSTAVDVEDAGYDNISGYGILQAYQAMTSLSPTPFASVLLDSVGITDGSTSNHNGAIDPSESGNIVVRIKNSSLKRASGVKGVLTTKTAGVTITNGTVTFGPIAPNGASATNTTSPFTFQVNNSVSCGSSITFFLKVTFAGGKTNFRIFEFTTNVGAQPYLNLAANLGTPDAGSGYTVSTGTQAGRLVRGTAASVCGTVLANPGVNTDAGLDPRLYDAYKFTNTSAVSQCITTTLNADSGLNVYTASYNDSGFVPSDPSKHFLGEPGQSALTQTYSFDVAAGKTFTVVVHEVNSGTLSGTPYTLSVSLSNCSSGSGFANSISLVADANKNSQVPLNWKIAAVDGVNHFEVERSTDGNNFSRLATVNAAALNSYSQTDALPAGGNNYYRIKQVNSNGSVAYSNIAAVKIPDFAGLTITPNPASNFVNVYAKSNMIQIQLLNPNGKLLQTVKPNASFYRLPLNGIAAGEYFLRIQTADGIINKKVIKQ